MRENLEDERDPSFNSSQMTTSTPSDKGEGRRETGTIPKVPRPLIEDVGEDMAEDGNHNDKKRRREQSVDMMDESVGVFSPIRGNLDVSRTPGTPSRGFQDRKTKSMETLRASDGATLQESTLGATGPRGSEEYHTAVSVTYTVEEEKKGTSPGKSQKSPSSGRKK